MSPATVDTLRERLPDAATVANPLDYTAMIWGEVDTLRDLVRTVGEDPAIGHVLVFYDRPPGISGHAAESWDAVEEGILAGAAVSPVPVMVAATLPELLDDEAAWRFCRAGRAGDRRAADRRGGGRRAGGAAGRVPAAARDRGACGVAACRGAGSRSTRRRRSFVRAACPSFVDGLH